MGSAAGAAVRPGKGHNAHLPWELPLAAVAQRRQGLRRGVGDLHRPVRPHGLVCQPLRLQSLLPGDGGVVVDGHHLRSQVKAHVVAVKLLTQDAGEDVLPGVLLHVVEPAGPVQGPCDLGPDLHRGGAGVENHAVFLVDVRHQNAA